MMFCWLYLTPSVTFLKVLYVILAAASAATLGYSDSIDRKDVASEDHSVLNSEKYTAISESLQSLPKPELQNMAPFTSEPLGFQNNDEPSHIIDQPVVKYEDDGIVKYKESDEKVEGYNKSNGSGQGKVVNCDKFCPHNLQQNNLSPEIHAVSLINEEKNNLKSPVVRIDLSSAEEIQEEESKLIQRDVADTYALDNYNENHKDITTAININNHSSTHLGDLYQKSVKVTDNISHFPYEESQLPSADELSSPVPVIEDQNTDHVLSSVSNNRSVGIYNSENHGSSTTIYDPDYVDLKPKSNVNQPVDYSTSSSEKFSKSSAILKNSSKSNKNKNSQEAKTPTKNTSNSQVKYSEESKKKSLTKILNEDSSENVSLQHASVIRNIDTVPLNDEPEDSSSQQKGRAAVLVPDEDSLEFSQQDNGTINAGVVNATVLETNETFSTTAHGHTMKSVDGTSGFDIAIISGIALSILVISSVIGAISFVVYRHRYWNKPQTLSDKCSNADSSGYIDDSTLRDNSEEMYSLDNDSFLNSLEAMTIQNYWTDNVKHTKL